MGIASAIVCGGVVRHSLTYAIATTASAQPQKSLVCELRNIMSKPVTTGLTYGKLCVRLCFGLRRQIDELGYANIKSKNVSNRDTKLRTNI